MHRRGDKIHRRPRPAPAPRTPPRSETDGRGGFRPAPAAATARPFRQKVRPRPVLAVKSTLILPCSLAGCCCILAWGITAIGRGGDQIAFCHFGPVIPA